MNYQIFSFYGCFTQWVGLESQVVPRCKALQTVAWQRHARFEATQQVRSNCDFQVETRHLATELAGGFTGVVFGPYATGNGQDRNAWATFRDFRYRAG